MADRPVRPVLAAVVLFVLAVFLARLMLAGGTAWIVLAVAFPIVTFALATRIRLVPALVVAALFAGAVVAFRFFLLENDKALFILLVLPAVVMGLVVAVKVFRSLRSRTAPEDPAPNMGGEKEGEKE